MNNFTILRLSISFWLFTWTGCTMVFGQDLIPTIKDGLYGFANPTGEIIIEPQFDKVSFFGHQIGPGKSTTYGDPMTDDLAIVYKDSTYNLITRTGDFILEEGVKHKPRINTHTLLNPARQKGELKDRLIRYAVNKINVKKEQFLFGYYFPSTKIFTDLIYSNKTEKQEIRVKVGVLFKDSIAGQPKMLIVAPLIEGQYDLLDEKGSKLLSNVRNIQVFNEGYFAWLDKENSWHYSHVLDGELFKGRYDLILEKSSKKKKPFVKVANFSLRWGESIGLMRLDGFEIIPPKYQKIELYPEVIVARLLKNTKDADLQKKAIFDYQILDLNGNILKTFEHPIERINETNFLLKGDSTQHIINIEGDTLFTTQTNYLQFVEYARGKYKYFFYQTDKFSGVMDLNFNPIFQYEGKVAIYPFERDKKLEEVNYFTIRVNNKIGLLTKKGKELIPPRYQNIDRTIGDYFLLKLNWNLMGLANSEGEIIFEPIYKHITVSFFEDLPYFKLKKEEYYTCLDGNLDSLSGFESTKSYVDREVLHVERIENKYALFNRFGKKLTPYKYKKIEIENILIEDKYYTSSYIANSNKIDLYTSTGELYKSNLDTTEINKLKVLPKYAKKDLEIYANCGGSLMVKKIQPDGNYLFGMLDGKGNWLVPLIYDRASPDFFDDEIWFSRIENKERISYVAECDGEMTRLGTYDKIYLQYSSYIGIRDGKSYIIDEDEINVEHALPIKKTSFGEQIYYYTLPGSKPELVWAKERNLKRLSSEIMLDSELPELVRLEEDRFLFYLNKRLYLLNNQADVLEEFDAENKYRANTFYHFIVKNTSLLKIKFDGEEYYYNYKTLTKFKQ